MFYVESSKTPVFLIYSVCSWSDHLITTSQLWSWTEPPSSITMSAPNWSPTIALVTVHIWPTEFSLRNLSQTMALLCTKPSNGFPFHSEKKPKFLLCSSSITSWDTFPPPTTSSPLPGHLSSLLYFKYDSYTYGLSWYVWYLKCS